VFRILPYQHGFEAVATFLVQQLQKTDYEDNKMKKDTLATLH